MTAVQSVLAGSVKERPKLVSYLRLGKARVYHYLYGWALGVLLLWSDGLLYAGALLASTCMLAGTLAIQWSASAADDVCGFLDGSDARNYAGRPLVTVVRKPLLTGALAPPQAIRFAVLMWIAGMLMMALAFGVLGWRPPVSAMVVAFAVPVLAVQYSCGIKLSYRRLGLESTIFLTGAFTVLMPYWFVAGTVSYETFLVGALFGLWLLLVVSYGNASDRLGDAGVSRRTLAVVLPPRWFAGMLHMLVVLNAVLMALLFTTPRLSPSLVVFSAPVVVLHGLQLYLGVYRRELRKARFLTLISIDLGFLGLACALLIGRAP